MSINLLAIAAGGALGAVLRHGVNHAVLAAVPTSFPLGVMVVNVLGSFVAGVLVSAFAHFYDPPQAMKLFLVVGFLGGFTTFSAFSMDAILLWERGQVMLAAAYVAGSVVLSLGALLAGMFLIRMISA